MYPSTRMPERPATLAEINAILGTTPRGTSAANVMGMNPEKISCSELLVSDRLSITGRMATRIIAVNGTATDAALSFVNGDRGTGFFSPAINVFDAVSGGQVIAQFAPTGLGITHIFSPTSVIDFGGATITNIGGMDITNSWSFSINPTSPTTTIDDTPTAILNIPVVPVGAPPCDVIFDIRAHVVFASAAAGSPSGSTTFRARIKRLAMDVSPTISALYDESIYMDAALTGASVTVEAVPAAAQIVAHAPAPPLFSTSVPQTKGKVSIPPPAITWTAMCSVVRTEILRSV